MGSPLFAGAPNSVRFEGLFRDGGHNLAEATAKLDQLMRAWPDDAGLREEIKALEETGDRITHDILHSLHSTKFTPLDREDIHALATALDDAVDYTEEAADFLGLYKIEAPMEQSQRMAHILLQATRQIAEAMPRLRTFQDLSHYTVEVNRLENDGDRTSRHAIASLFDNGIDPMVVIRWKDIFERLEEAIDACEHVANTLEGIVIKNS
jgi:predicted phosphate transport protein (TIGR00153 family)